MSLIVLTCVAGAAGLGLLAHREDDIVKVCFVMGMAGGALTLAVIAVATWIESRRFGARAIAFDDAHGVLRLTQRTSLAVLPLGTFVGAELGLETTESTASNGSETWTLHLDARDGGRWELLRARRGAPLRALLKPIRQMLERAPGRSPTPDASHPSVHTWSDRDAEGVGWSIFPSDIGRLFAALSMCVSFGLLVPAFATHWPVVGGGMGVFVALFAVGSVVALVRRAARAVLVIVGHDYVEVRWQRRLVLPMAPHADDRVLRFARTDCGLSLDVDAHAGKPTFIVGPSSLLRHRARARRQPFEAPIFAARGIGMRGKWAAIESSHLPLSAALVVRARLESLLKSR